MIALELEMTYRLDVAGPLESKPDGRGDAPANPRRIQWQMSEASLQGPRIRARSVTAGLDWFTPLPDGYGRPHVRLAFETDDGAIVLLEYGGLAEATPRFLDAVEQDRPTQWGDQYMRMALRFETDAPRYRWLMQSLFLARGRLLGARSIEYEVFRVL